MFNVGDFVTCTRRDTYRKTDIGVICSVINSSEFTIDVKIEVGKYCGEEYTVNKEYFRIAGVVLC